MKKVKGVKPHKAAIYVLLCCISISFVFPVVFMFTNSLMSSTEINETYGTLLNGDKAVNEQKSIDIKLIPDNVSLNQYYEVLLKKPKFIIMFWNSFIITIPIMLGQMAVASLAAFGFSKMRFPGRDKIFFVYIIVMMMPLQVTLVPNYLILRRLNIYGSYLSVILPGIFSAFGVFLLRQFMVYIPDEYIEAAKIDGVGYFKIFTDIILPQCKGPAASMAILTFADNWNMVEQPLIFLKDESMHPLSIFLSKINSGDLGVAFACGLIYMLPVLIIFIYGEDYLVDGIKLSGLK